MTMAVDLFRRLSSKKYMSKIDLTKGYWQIPVAPEDVYKSEFWAPDGHYEFFGCHLEWGIQELLLSEDLRSSGIVRSW